ncbi:hypothetical protein [Pararhodobacter sp.]
MSVDAPSGAPALRGDRPLASLDAMAAADERCRMADAGFFLLAPSGVGLTLPAAEAERAVGGPMPMRNESVTRADAALAQGGTR